MTGPDQVERPAQLTTIYSWVRKDALDTFIDRDVSYFEPPTLPAVRVWGEQLLQLWCERSGVHLGPSIHLRLRCAFGWPSATPDPRIRQAVAGRVRCGVQVEPSSCAIARMDLINSVFVESGWRGCITWLVEHGYSEPLLMEELAFLTEAMAQMRVRDARASVQSTAPEIIDGVLAYFAEDFRRYAESWGPFDPTSRPVAQGDGDAALFEVVYPREAVVGIEPDPH